MKNLAILLALAVPCSALAQEVKIEIVPTQGKALRKKIETSFEQTTSTTTLINGEERQGRGGFGGGEFTTSAKEVIEFDEEILKLNEEGQPTAVKRKYVKLGGESTRPGRDGDTKQEITSALEGKPLYISRSGEELTVLQGGSDGDEVEARYTRGLHLRTDQAGLAPGAAVKVGEEFELGETIRAALIDLNHPIVPAMEERGDDQGDQGGRRGRRGGGMRGMRGMSRNQTLMFFSNDKLNLEAKGKLISIDKIEGVSFATVEFMASVSGEGDPQELGMGFGGRAAGRRPGGREGRQGREMPEAEGSMSVSAKMKGKAVINLDEKRLRSLELEGESESSSEMKMTMDVRGEKMERETSMESSGTFSLKLSVGPAPAEEKTGDDDGK